MARVGVSSKRAVSRDLVGNDIPVFFIQDAMTFPDLVHAAKPEPHFARETDPPRV